jgi:hypothetical protein
MMSIPDIVAANGRPIKTCALHSMCNPLRMRLRKTIQRYHAAGPNCSHWPACL